MPCENIKLDLSQTKTSSYIIFFKFNSNDVNFIERDILHSERKTERERDRGFFFCSSNNNKKKQMGFYCSILMHNGHVILSEKLSKLNRK